MKGFLKVALLAVAWLTVGIAHAAELLVNTFLESRPFRGVEVELDGRLAGVTGDLGEVSVSLSAGSHELQFLKNGVPLADYTFSVDAGQSAEISVVFADFDTRPEVSIERYAADEPRPAGGATGVVAGEILNSEGLPLAGAVVMVAEADASVTTDEEGVFELRLPRGTYTLRVTHPEYETVTREDFRVVANVGLAANIRMVPRFDDVPIVEAVPGGSEEEVVVFGAYRPNENAVDVEKFSVAITDAISIDDLLRFGDSDVAAALRRLVGVSVTGGRYAVVRGLDGRYIAATLNGNLMPSTDPFRRDVQLDLFPNDILGSIEIQKSFTADIPGDTTGGIIKIRTRDIPDEYVNNLSASLGYTSGVTGKDLLSYRGGGSDFYGFDDGIREIPSAVYTATQAGQDFSVCQSAAQSRCTPLDQAAALASSLPNIYNTRLDRARPGLGLGYTLGNLFERAIGTVGLYGSASFDSKSTSRQDAFINIPNSLSSTYGRDEVETSLSGYFAAGVENDAWEARAKTMVLRSTEDTVEVEEGIDFEQNQALREFLIEWVERQFFAQQFEGVYFLPRNQQIDWRIGLSQSRRDSPDRRAYTYRGTENAEGGFNTPLITIPSIERSYAKLKEDGVDFGADYLLPITFNSDVSTDFSAGVLVNQRDRDSELVRLGFSGGNNVDRSLDLESLLTPENFASREFTLRATSLPTDTYQAEQDTLAYYLSTTTNIGQSWTVVAGLRKDDFTQRIDFPLSSAAGVEVESNEVLPSFGLTYRIGEKWQIRGGYSATVSRPNITENAPTRFFDERGREYIGCTASGAPACVASMIDNYDLRAEYYFDDQRDSISFAIFHKEIDDPLERAISASSGSSSNALTFRNNDSATVSGVEVDITWTALEIDTHGLTIGGNVAFIDSEIRLGALGQQLEADPNRELQGQSPFLANFQVGYDHYPTAQKLTLVVNFFDDRIDIVARAPQTPIFEVGRATVNLNYEKEFGNRSTLSLRARNLLDEAIQYEQNDRVIESYEEGIELSAGYTFRF